MTDDPGPEPELTGPRCPWCSTPVAEADTSCPSCGAALKEVRTDDAADIPGVTRVDPFAAGRRATPQLTGIVGWLAGVYETSRGSGTDGGTEASDGGVASGEAASVSPPSDAVRREMRRLEMQAIEAEIAAVEADARASGRLPAEPEPEPAEPEPADAEPGDAEPG